MWTLAHLILSYFFQTRKIKATPLSLCVFFGGRVVQMEIGGSNGGFHGYRRTNSSDHMKSPDISMGLPPPQTNNNHTAAAATEDQECVVREQDRFMPIANVIRIMRKILPPHAKISDDAKETIQECVSEYISFITSEANDRCQREQRKTITAEDVLWAMSKLGFDDYIEPLTIYLHRYREFDGGERGSLRGEPLVKRAVDHHAAGSMGFPGYPPAAAAAFHHMAAAHHHGFFGAAPPMNFFKDPNNAGPSQAAVACVEQYPQCKEQL